MMHEFHPNLWILDPILLGVMGLFVLNSEWAYYRSFWKSRYAFKISYRAIKPFLGTWIKKVVKKQCDIGFFASLFALGSFGFMFFFTKMGKEAARALGLYDFYHHIILFFAIVFLMLFLLRCARHILDEEWGSWINTHEKDMARCDDVYKEKHHLEEKKKISRNIPEASKPEQKKENKRL